MTYRLRSKLVSAVQWFPGEPLPGVQLETVAEVMSRPGGKARERRYYVQTIHETRAYLRPGDYVISEGDGQHCFPCSPEIFARSYDPVEAS